MPSESKSRFYLPELDGLRFIAFLLVFIHNAPSISSSKIWTALHEYGWVGVDLFFCLSGYLITKLLVMEHEQTGKINIRNFYFRRILRIWPLYFFYIVIGLIYILFTDGWHPVLPLHLIGLSAFTYNIVYLFLTYKVFAVYVHLWTISYEEQFYIAIPWVTQKFARNSKDRNWLIILVIFLAGNIIRAMFIFFNAKHPIIYMLPLTHFEAMLGGVAIGHGLFDRSLGSLKNWVMLLSGVTMIAIVFVLPNTYEIGWSLALTYPLAGTGTALIIFAIIKSKTSLTNKFLSTPLVIYLGKISYGLYIFHLLILSAIYHFSQKILGSLSQVNSTNQPLYFFSGLLITILLSIASYTFLEKPFLRLKKKYVFVKSRSI